MSRTAPRRTTVLTIGLGALLAPVVAPGVAQADPDNWRWMVPPAEPADPPVTSELLGRGEAGEFSIRNEDLGLLLEAEHETDLAVVRATIAPGKATGFHEHMGPSFAVVSSGRLRVVQPDHEDHSGCTGETFGPGAAVVHRSTPHNFVNPDDEKPTVLLIVYFVPEGASPAPIPVDAPRGC